MRGVEWLAGQKTLPGMARPLMGTGDSTAARSLLISQITEVVGDIHVKGALAGAVFDGRCAVERDQQDRLFRQGLALCRKGSLSTAAIIFRRLVELGSNEPLHLSYCGLLTTLVFGHRREGLSLCERALRFGADEPQVVVNVARVYEKTGQKTKAIKVLRRGLRELPAHAEMLNQINRLSPRRRPPLSFVDRNNAVNRQLAIFLARLSGRRESEEGASTMNLSPTTQKP